MEGAAFVFGIMGFMFGILSYKRIDKLEAKLKELDVINHDFKSS